MKGKICLCLLLIAAMIMAPLRPASAATYTAATWLSPRTSDWSNDGKTFSELQNFGAQPYKEIFTYREGGALQNVVYCLSPQSRRSTGDVLTDFSDSYVSNTWWNAVLASNGNGPGTSKRVTELLSYILYFGYVGRIADHTVLTEEDMADAAVLKAFDEALATQILVWEVIVGERNADFSKRAPAAGYDAVLDLVKTSMPGYEQYFRPGYDRIAGSVQRMLKTPSFLSETADGAARNKFGWDGSKYTLTLTDTNDCLEFWDFSGPGLTFTKDGNRLIITAERLENDDDIPVTAVGTVHSRSMIVQASSGTYHWNDVQPTVIPGTHLTTSRNAYLSVYGDASGSVTLTKVSDDPAVSDGNSCYSFTGIRYGVYTNASCTALAKDYDGNDAVFTLTAAGTAGVLRMHPGTYYIKEISVPAGCGYRLDTETVKTVGVVPGESATVSFSDTPVDDPAGLTIRKTNEKGQTVPGADLSGARYEIRFYAGQYTKATLPARADAVWVIETKQVGSLFYAQLSDTYRVSGDTAKYGSNPDGSYVIPLGTLTVQEIQAPPGFQIEGSTMQLAAGDGSDAADGVSLMNIVDQNSSAFVRSGNQTADTSEGFEILQKEKSIPVIVNVRKVNSSGAPIRGVVFNLRYADADGTVRDHRMTTDSSGKAQWTGITYGIEGTLYEVSAPAGYKVDPAAAAGITRALTGTFDTSSEFYVCSFDDVTNDDDGGKVTVRKTSDGPTLEGFTFKITGTSALGTAVNKTAVTGSNGIADFGFIPTGTYTVSEINTPVYMSVTPASQSVSVGSTDVQVSFTNSLKTGIVNVTKSIPAGSNASLEGFTFRLSGTSDAGTNVNVTATTDSEGKATFTDVPYGTYDIKEELTEAQALVWKGKDKEQVTVSATASTVPYTLENEPLTGAVNVTKTLPEGATVSLEGFTFRLSGTSYTGMSVNVTATTDSEGKATFSDVPYGTYDIKEELTEAQAKIWKGKEKEQVTVSSTATTVPYTLENEPLTGTVNVTKTLPAGATVSLEGFTFRLSGTSDIGMSVNMTATTDSEGKATFTDVPYGTYDIKEELTEAQAKIWKGKDKEQVTVSCTAETVLYSLENEPLIGTVNVTKTLPEGATASPEGFTFRLSGTSDIAMNVNMTATTNSEGKAIFTDVPYGTYDIQEELTEAQALVWKGKDKEPVTVSSTATTVPYTLENEPLTGTVNVTKTLPEGATASLEDFTFRLSGTSDAGTSVNMIATTDSEGKATFTDVPYGTYDIKEELTSEQAKIWKGKDKAQVTVSADQDAATYVLTNEEITIPVKVIKTSDSGIVEGFTFTLTGTRTIGGTFTATTVTDSAGKANFGEVPYGTYTVTEAPDPNYLSNGPWNFTLDADTQSPYTVSAHNSRVKIETLAKDSETHVGVSEADDSVIINDTVHYYNLVPGTTYKFVGTVMDAETKEPFKDASGAVVTVTKEYQAEASEGSFVMTFEINAEGFAGRKLVIFEELYLGDDLLAEHKDFADDSQTVYLPEVTTDAKDDATRINHSEAIIQVSITDTVTYKNLRPGKEYVVKGILMDKATGNPLLDGGNEITAEKPFTPDAANGTVELTFTFDASSLGGTTVVVFETVYYNNVAVAVHADIDDEDQTIYIPEIRTTATSDDTDDHVGKASGSMTITDVVACKGLEVGREYVVKGILMDKASGDPLVIDGKEVTAEASFTADAAEGTVELTFSFDGSALAGKMVVAFETLFTEGKEAAVHADLSDENQTVYIPKIFTNAKDEASETKTVTVSETAVVIDAVSYQGLAPGREYVVKGVLMDQETGKALLIDGKEITAEAAFTPEKSDGEIEIRFLFNAALLRGRTLVVFERLYLGKCEVAAHTDLNDPAQTLEIPPAPPAPDPEPPKDCPDMGETNALLWPALLLVFSAAGAVLLLIRRKKK